MAVLDRFLSNKHIPHTIMEWSYTGKILLLMIFMIQSSIGLALSLPHLVAYSRLNPGQKARGIIEFFFTLAFTLNAVMLFLCLVSLLMEVAIAMAVWARRREEPTETTNEYT